MGYYCRICNRNRPNESFSRKGRKTHICKGCLRLRKEERLHILETGEVIGFLHQSNISEKNLKRLNALPIFVVYMFLFGTREMLAQNIALDDLPSSEEIMSEDDDFEQFDSLIIDERDQKLIEYIARLEDQQNDGCQQVAIVYGARHMRSTTDFLMQKLNYRLVKAEWLKVFDL